MNESLDISGYVQAGLNHPAACLAFLAIDILGWKTGRFLNVLAGKSFRQIKDIVAEGFARQKGLRVESVRNILAPLGDKPRRDDSTKGLSILDSDELVFDVEVSLPVQRDKVKRWRCLMRASLLAAMEKAVDQDAFNMRVAPHLVMMDKTVAWHFKGQPRYREDICQEARQDAWRYFVLHGDITEEVLKRLSRNAADRWRQRLNRQARRVLPAESATWAFQMETIDPELDTYLFFEGKLMKGEEVMNLLLWRSVRTMVDEPWTLLLTIGIKLLDLTPERVCDTWKDETLRGIAMRLEQELRIRKALPKREIDPLMGALKNGMTQKCAGRRGGMIGDLRWDTFLRRWPKNERVSGVSHHLESVMTDALEKTQAVYWREIIKWRWDV